jgi:NAD(P)-dependent dehydrogenase (short-subunit alcohol dehydrogenase family)
MERDIKRASNEMIWRYAKSRQVARKAGRRNDARAMKLRAPVWGIGGKRKNFQGASDMSGDLFSVAGKRVLVTGGSRGIGKMIAEAFVRAGSDVTICARKQGEIDACVAELSPLGKIKGIRADLGNYAGIDAFTEQFAKDGARLDVLVNNAGAAWGEALETYPESGFDRCWSINVKGLFHLTQKMLPLLRAAATKESAARVINIGSIDGMRVADTENYAYSATKAAVHQLTRQLAHKLVSEHIHVNAIAPGLFPSKITAFLFKDEESESILAGTIPMGRTGRGDDIGGVAIFLSSRASGYMTGAVLQVDGGLSTHG